MDLKYLLKTENRISVSIGIEDLREWHKEVIADTRRVLEESIVNEKAERYLTVKQVVEMLNVDQTTLWRWNKKGYLKPIEFGGGRRYKMSDVKALMNGGAKR